MATTHNTEDKMTKADNELLAVATARGLEIVRSGNRRIIVIKRDGRNGEITNGWVVSGNGWCIAADYRVHLGVAKANRSREIARLLDAA